MSLVGLFLKPSGTTLRLKLTPSDDVGPFVVFVRKFTATGAAPEVTWLPDDLTTGTQLVLGGDSVEGYHLILDAHVMPGGEAAILSELTFDNDQPLKKLIALPQSEAPVARRRWSIVINNSSSGG